MSPGLEALIREAVEILRANGRTVVAFVDGAVVDFDADGDGRLDANPDKGAGSEPGILSLDVDGVRFVESEFEGDTTRGIVRYVERVLAMRGAS